MWEYFTRLFSAEFMPHGHCYLWRPDILWVHVLSDSGIFLAYAAIPVALVVFVRKREDLAFNWIFMLFATFIFACGLTHVMEIWSVWYGTYRLTGVIKAGTAVVSLLTAAALWPLLPKALALPSTTQMARANSDLQEEIRRRQQAEEALAQHAAELERRVAERTAALQEANTALRREVAERQQAEEALQRYAAELERRNKELDDFAYVASHDLKAPLRAIQHLAGWVVEDAGAALPDAARHHLTLLLQRVERMDNLLASLLAYARIGRMTGESRYLDSGELVRHTLPLLEIPPQFVIDIVTPMPSLLAPAVPLELVFRNLIDNAIKHHDRDNGHITIRGQDAGAYVEFAITDDGPGIPSTYHERIFHMFQTLKPRDEVEGSGMGLALVQKTLEVHGGTIHVESATARGTTFRFTWPKPRGHTEQAPLAAHA
jgi:signal transduction histidine kinase